MLPPTLRLYSSMQPLREPCRFALRFPPSRASGQALRFPSGQAQDEPAFNPMHHRAPLRHCAPHRHSMPLFVIPAKAGIQETQVWGQGGHGERPEPRDRPPPLPWRERVGVRGTNIATLPRPVYHPPLNPLPSREGGSVIPPSPLEGEGWGEGDQHRNASPSRVSPSPQSPPIKGGGICWPVRPGARGLG